jgi:hypothetical protein
MTTSMATEQTTNIAKRQSFIQALELPPIPETFRGLSLGSVQATADQKAGFVDDGGLVSFVAEVGSQVREDVLNSTLLASLAANKKFDRFKDTENWYKFYVDVLMNVGWVLQSLEFSEYDPHGATFEVDKVVFELLAAIASENQIAVAIETMEALKALEGNDGRVVLFSTASTSLGNGSFQISPVTETNGATAMGLGAFYFTSTQSTTRFLWFQYDSSDIHLFKAVQAVTLDQEIYDKVRQTVIDKLGNNAKTFIGDLDV